jgi:hypothetical protein
MSLLGKLHSVYFSVLETLSLWKRIDTLQQAVGRIEMRQLALENNNNIHVNEFKVSSQNGEDGILQFLLRKVDIKNEIFVEFGVHDYTESNTRFLLTHNRWSGLVIDGSLKNIETIKRDNIYWQHNLKSECAFIDKDNINDLILSNGISGDIGILSIDIDGNDYWVWNSIECINPRIVICEYNSLFGWHKKVTTPYDKNFVITKAHFSGLYWGASIAAFDYLAKKKGYSLVGSNTAGNNLFFVRNDVLGNLPTYTPEQAYVKSQFRISRDKYGNLTFLDFDAGLKIIESLPLYEVDTEINFKVKDIILN